MSSEATGEKKVVEWQDPPEAHGRRGRRPNPRYDNIVQVLQTRPGAFAVVGSFPTYGKALSVQQVLQNRRCHVTTRKTASGDIDVYAAWPASTPAGTSSVVSADPAVSVVWRQPPAKRAGIRQSWEEDPV